MRVGAARRTRPAAAAMAKRRAAPRRQRRRGGTMTTGADDTGGDTDDTDGEPGATQPGGCGCLGRHEAGWWIPERVDAAAFRLGHTSATRTSALAGRQFRDGELVVTAFGWSHAAVAMELDTGVEHTADTIRSRQGRCTSSRRSYATLVVRSPARAMTTAMRVHVGWPVSAERYANVCGVRARVVGTCGV